MTKKYPGRQSVIAREDALDILYDQAMGVEGRWPCTQPFIVSAIGLPSGLLNPADGRVPVEIPTRCRKCENCLKHRRQLWTARAVDEIKFSARTWFGTLTVAPEHRFTFGLRADMDAQARGWEPISQQQPRMRFAI